MPVLAKPASRAIALVVLVPALLWLAGCSSGSHGSASSGSGGNGAPSSPAVKEPKISVGGPDGAVPYTEPVKLTIADGTFSSVQVTDADSKPLDGSVAPDGASWSSQQPPLPAATFTVTADVKDSTGTVSSKRLSFTVAQVPNDKRVSFTVTPDDRATVGIGQPIVVRFATAVTERAAMEKVMTVDAAAPGGGHVTGSWHWLSGTEVHWRPQAFWTPGTTVHLDMKIAGVKAAADRFGRKNYSETFTIGESHVTQVDATAHRVQVFRDGKLTDTWPAGTGRPGLETYSGTYVVLGKAADIEMDSCSARITCDKKDPDYYDEKEKWATRITASGTFLHAASWDGRLGRANVSHGCIHLSDGNAQDFYNHAVPGDVVVVKNTGRGPQERITSQDPGLYDWNQSWTAWQAGSALK